MGITDVFLKLPPSHLPKLGTKRKFCVQKLYGAQHMLYFGPCDTEKHHNNMLYYYFLLYFYEKSLLHFRVPGAARDESCLVSLSRTLLRIMPRFLYVGN